MEVCLVTTRGDSDLLIGLFSSEGTRLVHTGPNESTQPRVAYSYSGSLNHTLDIPVSRFNS